MGLGMRIDNVKAKDLKENLKSTPDESEIKMIIVYGNPESSMLLAVEPAPDNDTIRNPLGEQ